MNKVSLVILLAFGLSAIVGCDGNDDGDNGGPIPDPPNTPVNVSADLHTDTWWVEISWEWEPISDPLDQNGIADGFRVERQTGAADWVVMDTVETYGTYYWHWDVDALRGFMYNYRVGAFNADGTTYGEADTCNVPSFHGVLEAVWVVFQPELLGVDSASTTFFDDAGFRRYELYDDALDSEIWEEGTFTADEDSIEFHVTMTHEGTADTTYTIDYYLFPDMVRLNLPNGPPLTILHFRQ